MWQNASLYKTDLSYKLHMSTKAYTTEIYLVVLIDKEQIFVS